MKVFKTKKRVPGGRWRELARGINRRICSGRRRKLPGQEEIEQCFRLLCTGTDAGKEMEDYYIEKTALVLKLLAVGTGMSLLILLSSRSNTLLTDGYFLPRREQSYIAELWVKAGEETKREVSVSVEPKIMSKEESRILLKNVKEHMENYILGENSSLEEVRSDLKLIRAVEGTPVVLDWELDSYYVMNMDGSIRKEHVEEEGTIVELTARLTCEKEEAVYRAYAKVLPPVLSADEIFMQKIREELDRLQETGGGQEKKELPSHVEGVALVWKEKGSVSVLAFLLLTGACAILLYIGKDQEIKKKIEERERQMKRDYARIVSKLVLLLDAGMTIRGAWEIVVRDYLAKREKGEENYRYAYEEMALTSREMQNGIAEAMAYENFGVRCRVPCYLKLSALLGQNLAKGSKGLTGLLNSEVREAFEQRKDLARRRGEEAATKLLLPMILLFVVVMILILVPAGMSMQM